MDILGANMTQIDLVDSYAVLHVECHARWCDMVGNPEFRVRCQFGGIRGLAHERTLRSAVLAPRIRLLHGTDDLEEARASADAVCLECRGDGKADGLARAAFVRNDEMCGQRIESAFHTFDRGEECLEVDGDICALLHVHPSCYSIAHLFVFCK